MYSFFSMTTMDTPLLVVSMAFSQCLLSSLMALALSLLMSGLGGVIFFRMSLIWPLSSSASPWFHLLTHSFNLSYVFANRWVIGNHSKIWDPWAKTFSCASVSGVFDRLFTHFFTCCCCCWVIFTEVLFSVLDFLFFC